MQVAVQDDGMTGMTGQVHVPVDDNDVADGTTGQPDAPGCDVQGRNSTGGK